MEGGGAMLIRICWMPSLSSGTRYPRSRSIVVTIIERFLIGPSSRPEIDEEEAESDSGGAHDPERRIGNFRQFEQIDLDLVGKGEIGEPFDNEDHPQDAKKILHRFSEYPFI